MLNRLRERLQGALGRRHATPQATQSLSPESGAGAAETRTPTRIQTRILKVGSQRVAFGLNWQPHAGLEWPKQLAHLKAQGFKAYATSVPPDLVGVADVPVRGKTAAAALALADRHAKGGTELFVFRIEASCVLLALSDGQPVPGFDVAGVQNQIASTAELFKQIKSGQPIRLVGNVDWLAGMEPLSPEQAFSNMASHVRLHPVQDWRALLPRGLLVLALLALVGGVGTLAYKAEQERQALAEQVPADPNVAYEQDLAQTLLRVAPAGSGSVQSWADTVRALPVSLAGWTLVKVQCRPDACKAAWKRQYGSYDDFSRAAETDLGASVVMAPGKDLAEAEVSTLHPIGRLPAERLQRQHLPSSQEAQQSWGGRLQDLLLLGASKAQLSDFKLFGASAAGSEAGLRAPVFRADFKLESGLWLLDELDLPPYAVPESLDIQFSLDGSSGTQEVQRGSFILSGAVFTHGYKR